uniref:Uncharacterized protein n=1 Tax=Romanomermis culicivorax TaxID=13658 RepID=A0A915IP32_ROMCU
MRFTAVDRGPTNWGGEGNFYILTSNFRNCRDVKVHFPALLGVKRIHVTDHEIGML